MPYVKNTAGQALGFKMVSRTDGRGVALLTVVVTRSIDGGGEFPATGTVRDLGAGHYVLVMTAGDTNGGKITFYFREDTCVPQEKTIAPFDVAGLPVAYGGTGADLSATGPGAVVQGGVGAPLSVDAALPTVYGGTGADMSATGPGAVVQESSGSGFTVETRLGLDTGGTSADLSATGPGLVVQPGIGSALSVIAGLGVSLGGTGADLSATGPGVLTQAATGGNVVIVAPGTSGNVLTSVGGVWASAAPPSAAIAIGSVITGGTPGDVLTVGAGPVLAQTSLVALAHGGTGADLSATGPGVLVQSALGASVSEVVPGTSGNVLTSAGGVWTSAAPAGITGTGSATQVVFWTGASAVSGSAQLTFDPTFAGLAAAGSVGVGAGVLWTADNLSGIQGGLDAGSGDQIGALIFNGNSNAYVVYLASTDAVTGGNCAGFFTNQGLGFTVILADDAGHAVQAVAGTIQVPGTTANTFVWVSAASAPATHAIVSLPLAFYGPAAPPAVLATPDAWALVTVNGVDYKIPCYL